MEVVRLMGLDLEEIARGLAGMPGQLQREGATFLGRDGDARWSLVVEALPARTLGSMLLPCSRVTLRLEGFSPREAAVFVEAFDRRFQRAGG